MLDAYLGQANGDSAYDTATHLGVQVEIMIPFAFWQCMPDYRFYMEYLEEVGR